MRNLSLLFLLFLLSILGCQSSKTSKASTQADSERSKTATKAKPLYKPFSEFNGDTLQYLNYNFVEHKEQYVGKTFALLYHDLEIPVKSSLTTTNHHDQLTSPSLSLYFVDDATASYHMNSDAGPLYILIVKWEKPVSSEALFQLDMANDLNWSPKHEVLLAGEIIKDVAVMKYVNPQSKKQ